MSKPRNGRLMYAASETCADMLYALGFVIPDAALWFSLDGEGTVVVSPLEIGRARKQAKPGLTVLGSGQFKQRLGLDPDKQVNVADLVAALTQKHEVDLWEIPFDFPAGVAAEIQKNGIELEPVRCFWPRRACKKAEEVKAVAEGVELARLGLDRALGILSDAKTSIQGTLMWGETTLTAEILQGEINAEIARNGGVAMHTIAAPGTQAADPHCTGSGPVYEGQPVVIDIFPRVMSTGYHGDLTRTVVKGEADPRARSAFDTVNAARQAAIARVKAGVPAKEVHNAAAEVIENAGYETDTDSDIPSGFIHGTGHGLGLEVHEAPRVSPRSEATLEAGHVITIEPGVYYPEWGGVRIEDVVVVTENGCRNLTEVDIVLEI